MQIQEARPAVLPKTLRAELQSEGKSVSGIPGFILDAEPLMGQSASIRNTIAGLALGLDQPKAPCLVIPPNETSTIFKYDKELDLLRSVAGLIGEQIHPQIKTGVDALWLVYRAFQLREEWAQPGRDTGACLFKLANIALGAVAASGRVYPDLKLSDAWANGLNFVVKGGGALWEGKAFPLNELVWSTETRLQIPLKIMKVAGISMDPGPFTLGSPPLSIGRPEITRLSPGTAERALSNAA